MCRRTCTCVCFSAKEGYRVYVYACMCLLVCINKYNDIYKYICLHTHTNNGLKQYRSSKKVYKIICSLFCSFARSLSLSLSLFYSAQLLKSWLSFSLSLYFIFSVSVFVSVSVSISLFYSWGKINEITLRQDSFSDKTSTSQWEKYKNYHLAFQNQNRKN